MHFESSVKDFYNSIQPYLDLTTDLGEQTRLKEWLPLPSPSLSSESILNFGRATANRAIMVHNDADIKAVWAINDPAWDLAKELFHSVSGLTREDVLGIKDPKEKARKIGSTVPLPNYKSIIERIASGELTRADPTKAMFKDFHQLIIESKKHNLKAKILFKSPEYKIIQIALPKIEDKADYHLKILDQGSRQDSKIMKTPYHYKPTMTLNDRRQLMRTDIRVDEAPYRVMDCISHEDGLDEIRFFKNKGKDSTVLECYDDGSYVLSIIEQDHKLKAYDIEPDGRLDQKTKYEIIHYLQDMKTRSHHFPFYPGKENAEKVLSNIIIQLQTVPVTLNLDLPKTPLVMPQAHKSGVRHHHTPRGKH